MRWFQKITNWISNKRDSNSILAKRLRRFKSIKRGYYSFLLLLSLYFLSFLLPVLVNDQPLISRVKKEKWDPGEEFTDINGNGKCDDAEYFEDEGNEKYDQGEEFEDLNQNGKWDEGEHFIDLGNGKWDKSENFIDKGDGEWNEGEEYIDANNNGKWDSNELFIDKGDGEWNEGEEYTDVNNNGKWDKGEDFIDKGDGVWNKDERLGSKGVYTCIHSCSPSPPPLSRQKSAEIKGGGGLRVHGKISGFSSPRYTHFFQKFSKYFGPKNTPKNFFGRRFAPPISIFPTEDWRFETARVNSTPP